MATTTNPSTTEPSEVVLISHSPIFYWWPVWLVGFLLSALTYLDDRLMVVVPVGTVAEAQKVVEGVDGPRDLLVLPQGQRFPADATGAPNQPHLRMATSSGLGMVYAVIFSLVLLITNIHMRGLWSVIVLLSVALGTILLAALGMWDPVLRTLGLIDIHINAMGYLTLSLILSSIWLLTFLLYDRRNSMIFGRGQLRVRTAIGAGEKVYDSFGMSVERHRDDLFRHWLLGFGSGDLTVRPAGANAAPIPIPNVLGVNRKLELIQRMLQERQVVGPPLRPAFRGVPLAVRVGTSPLSNTEDPAMSSPDFPSRREFVKVAGLAAGLALPGSARSAAAQSPTDRSPDAVLARLLEGNRRFVEGKLAHPGRSPKDFVPLAEGQAPLAIIVGCADSRVAPELAFDQGVGDLFVVRVAGNVVSGAGANVKGSIEFAVAELGARLIMVLAHTQCGAVKAAIQHIEDKDALPGSIGELIDPIRPAVRSVAGRPGDKLENVTRANVELGVERLKGLDPILAKLVRAGELKVVGATYDLRTGKVEVFG